MTDGVSVVRVINTFYREQKQEKEGLVEKEKIKNNQEKMISRETSPTKRHRLPPGSPRKRMISSPRKRLTNKDNGKINRYPNLFSKYFAN